MKTLSYIKSRLSERSTWMLIGSGIGTAAMLDMPWSAISAIVHAIAALVPDGPVKK